MRTNSSRTGRCRGWLGGGRKSARSAAGWTLRAASNASMNSSRSIQRALGVRRGSGWLMVLQEGSELLAAVLQRPLDGAQAAAGQLGDFVHLVALQAQL